MDTDNLIYVLEENVKGDINDFGDLINLDSALSRSIVIGSIEDGTGIEVDSVIRYWNRQDEKHNIPIVKREPKDQFIGFIHISFSVGSKENVDKLTAQLKEDGYEIIDGPRTTGDGFYEACVLDPENNRVEFTI